MSSYSKEINDLLTEASKLYASKKYDLASLEYGKACELYSSENDGDENIELLFLYGKSLFQSGVSKSEAFGGGSEAAATQNQNQQEDAEDEGDLQLESANFQFNETLAEEEDEEEGEIKGNKDSSSDKASAASATADIESDDEEEEVEEEQTDFELLWDILDLTRALIEEKLTEFKEEDKSKDSPLIKDLKLEKQPYVNYLEKLSETFDLLGEVSLELENFPQAASDLSRSLELREQLYPQNAQSISESHYKLSLAFEFCVEDPDSRSKAAEQMKLALDIVKSQPEKDEELIKDLEVRLTELKKDPAEELQAEKERIIKGILGEKVDDDDGKGSKSQVASSTGVPPVNDLTSMIVKKKRKSDNKKIPGQKRQKQ